MRRRTVELHGLSPVEPRSSGSSLEESAVDPTRSANITVSCRRSASVGMATALMPAFSDASSRKAALGRVFWLLPSRRLRFRHPLHLAGLDADQMVSRPARHGHHGLRRRRLHRFTAVGVAEPLLDATHVGVAETLIVMGAVYCVLCRRGCRNSRSPHLATMAARSSFTTDKHACPEPMHNPLRDDARPLRPWSYTSRSVNTARAHNRVRISRKYCHRHANQETREN
jgi:hypothetical protein